MGRTNETQNWAVKEVVEAGSFASNVEVLYKIELYKPTTHSTKCIHVAFLTCGLCEPKQPLLHSHFRSVGLRVQVL